MIDSTASDADEQQALDRIASGTEENWGEAAVVLSSGAGEKTDHELLAVFHTAGDRGEQARAELVSRILAERNPDRDPSYAERLIPDRAAAAERSPHGVRFAEWLAGGVPAAAEEWGFTRLRRLEPVRRYADQLHEGAGPSRLMATLGLGETADADAFDALLIALSDRWASVRSAAAQAVRRLVLSGLADEYHDHPVRQRLAELLTDDNHRVRVDAARTLSLFGDEALVADALSKVSWWQRKWKRELEAALRGDVPPLRKMWIGDRSV